MTVPDPLLPWRPKVKVCGLQQAADARFLAELGATHFGCVLTPGSRRAVGLVQVRAVVEAAGDLADVVLVFHRTAATSEVLRACLETGTAQVQMPGADVAACRHLEQEGLVVWRSFAIDPRRPRLPRPQPPASVLQPIVCDAGGPDDLGPSVWPRLVSAPPPFALLRGALDAGNVGQVLRARPYGLDLTAALERAPGVLDRAAGERLLAAVAAACRAGVRARSPS